MKTAKFLFWLGIGVMIVQLIGTLMIFGRMAVTAAGAINRGSLIASFANPFFSGGVLIGLSKIIERLYVKE